jgi:hypothetical protein
MRIFVGYGYNPRDSWIEKDVFPILEAMHLHVVHGKNMHGQVLQDGVKDRIEQSDALIGFCTMRSRLKGAEFNSHIWVRDEMVHALARQKPVVEIREKGVANPPGITGDRQRIELDPKDRLSCIAELVKAVNSWRMRRLLLVSADPKRAKKLRDALVTGQLVVEYMTRIHGVNSPRRSGRIELVDNAFYLNAIGLPDSSLVQVEGTTKSGGLLFNTGWASADLVRIEF